MTNRILTQFLETNTLPHVTPVIPKEPSRHPHVPATIGRQVTDCPADSQAANSLPPSGGKGQVDAKTLKALISAIRKM